MKKRFDGPWFVYILISKSKNRTYVGATKNPILRIKRHNGHINGGAKATRTGRPWEYAVLIKDLPNSHYGLCLEWAIKHCRKGPGIHGRCKALKEILEKIFWTSTCLNDIDIRMECQAELKSYFQDLKNVSIDN